MVAQDWDDLVDEFGPLVYSSAWRILGHREQAEDVTQDVFAFASSRRNEPIQNFAGWLSWKSTGSRRMANATAIALILGERLKLGFRELWGLVILLRRSAVSQA